MNSPTILRNSLPSHGEWHGCQPTVGPDPQTLPPPQNPRVVGRTRHHLLDIVVPAICGVIANCDDWSDIALFAKKREGWFKRFLALPGGTIGPVGESAVLVLQLMRFV